VAPVEIDRQSDRPQSKGLETGARVRRLHGRSLDSSSGG
jgi:hypothetical protein